MKQISLIIILFILFSSISFACSSSGTIVNSATDCCSYQAQYVDNLTTMRCIDENYIMESLSYKDTTNLSGYRKVEAISEDVISMQYTTATTHTTYDVSERAFEGKKTLWSQASTLVWSYTIAFFLLIYELVLVLLYMFEMRIIIYFFLTLLPGVFFSLRDGLVKAILRSKS